MPDPKSPPAPESKPAKPEPAPESSNTDQPSTPDPQPAELKTVHSSPLPHDKPIPQPDDTAASTPLEREELLKQATLFLETGSVRDAPDAQKREFLKSKGLTDAEAATLTSQLSGKQYAARPPVPTPAIITYPEFLAPPPPITHPPPITAATILKSLYFGAATAAMVYGANKLVVSPMLDALTAARMDFTATVSKNLDGLTERLVELAPPSYVPGRRAQKTTEDEDAESDDGSSISDPSELFHVDAATQTVPEDTIEEAGAEETPDGKLDTLTEQMRVLVEAHSDGTDSELTFLLEDLTTYLEGLTYDSGIGTSMFSNIAGYPMPNKEKDKDDPIQKFKQEIRSVKGVLLNSKNFPASRR